jgi:Na+-driven multidrug efflux pump
MIRNITMLVLMRIAAVFGTMAVAAFGIGMRLQMFILGPGKGFGLGAATMVGQNLGAGNIHRAYKSGWFAALAAMAIGLALAGLFWINPSFLITVFNKNEQVVEIGSKLLLWFSASFPFMVLGIVLKEAMIGAGDSLRPMVITLIAQTFVAVPFAVFLAFTWNSVNGVWAALFIANFTSGILAAAAFKYGAWLKQSLAYKQLFMVD